MIHDLIKTGSRASTEPGSPSRRLLSVALTLLLVLGQSNAWSNPHFRAPYSGERVETYEVTLPVNAQDKGTYQIPRDCPKAHAAFRLGADQWCSRVERRVWDKVMQDCYYATFLQRARTTVAHDFVTGFDFKNSDLRELAAAAGCDAATDRCESMPPGFVELKQVLTLGPRESQEGVKPSAEQCRVENGVFRGWVSFDPDGMKCLLDRHANGFRMVAIDYADVNADGYLDAVIRLVPLGRGLRHQPLILPLTRTAADGPFSLPRQLVRF